MQQGSGVLDIVDFPDTFPVYACWCPQTLEFAQPFGPIVKPHGNGVMGLSIVEFRPGGHASFQKISGWYETVGRSLHGNSTSGHDDQNPSLGNMTRRHIAHH